VDSQKSSVEKIMVQIPCSSASADGRTHSFRPGLGSLLQLMQ
jgi:hypothetical protein